MPAPDVRLNPIRDTQFPLKEGVCKNKQTHGYPGGGGVVFSKDPVQLESGSVSVLGFLKVALRVP